MLTFIVVCLFAGAMIGIGIYYESVRYKEVIDSIKQEVRTEFQVKPSDFKNVKLLVGKLVPSTEHTEEKPDDYIISFNVPKDIENQMLSLSAITSRGVFNYYNKIKDEFGKNVLQFPSLDINSLTFQSDENSVTMICKDLILTFSFGR